MKKYKYEQYFHCFIVCILVPLLREAFISMWIPNSEVLIKRRRSFEVRRLLEEIRYFEYVFVLETDLIKKFFLFFNARNIECYWDSVALLNIYDRFCIWK